MHVWLLKVLMCQICCSATDGPGGAGRERQRPLPEKYSVLFCYMANVGIIMCPEAKVMSTF